MPHLTKEGLIPKIHKELKKLDNKPNNSVKWGTDLNREFSKEESQMPENHLNKYSASLTITEMKIKTFLRFCLTPDLMAKIKNTNDSSCW